MPVPAQTPDTDPICPPGGAPSAAAIQRRTEDDLSYCNAMLPRVSRTFALCIRLLPPELERSVMVAYLLCRIADTIEDAEQLPVEQKQTLLRHFAASLSRPRGGAGYLRQAFAPDDGAESHLCHNAGRVLGAFGDLDPAEQDAIRPWVEEMCCGMIEFSRQPRANGTGMPSLERVQDLDRYCYYVAGTVGHLLTALFGLRLARRDRERLPPLEARATNFGLGLQLTNIIKDAAGDHRLGWSFIPRELCLQEGITVDQLFGPEHADASHRVFAKLIQKARDHLEDALQYTTQLPATQYRIRIFCLTSLYFAVRTLGRAAQDDGKLTRGDTIKISRAEVYRTLAVTCLVAPSNGLIRWYFRRLAGPSAATQEA